MNDFCILRTAAGETYALCEGEQCPFWRVVEHVGDAPGAGCPIKHYQLLGNDGVAEWLLSVRERLIRLESGKDVESAD